MPPDTPISEADPADTLDQLRDAAPARDEDLRPPDAWEADPADVADQHRDASQDDEDY